MVRTDKLPNALYALNAVLVLARSMAYRNQPGNLVADVLDVAEYLPRLLAEPEDRTDEFRGFLVDLAAKNKDFQLAVLRFDREVPTRW
jgi:hypothetical protein